MIKHTAKIIAIFFIALSCKQSLAQDIEASKPIKKMIGLDGALKVADQNAPQLDISGQELALREAQLGRAKAAFILPKLEVNVLAGLVPDLSEDFGPANNFPDFTPGVSNLGPFVRTQINFVQPLFVFNKLKNIKKAAQNGVLSAEQGLKAKRNEIREQVQTVYWTHVYLQNLQKFIDELLDRAYQAREKVQEGLDNGSGEVTDVDLMRIKVFINETMRRQADAQRGIATAEYTLKLLMGMDSRQIIKIEDTKLPKPKIELKSEDHYLARAKVARPEIQQLEKGLLAQKHLMQSKKADFYPSIAIVGQGNYAETPGRAQFLNPYINDGFNQQNFGASLGIQQNLSFHNISAQYKEEKVKFKLAQSKVNLALQGIELDIRDKYLNLKARQQAYESSTKALKSARSWVLSSTLNFGAGVVNSKELLESFVGYATVKTNFYEAVYRYHKAIFALRRAVGEDIAVN